MLALDYYLTKDYNCVENLIIFSQLWFNLPSGVPIFMLEAVMSGEKIEENGKVL